MCRVPSAPGRSRLSTTSYPLSPFVMFSFLQSFRNPIRSFMFSSLPCFFCIRYGQGVSKFSKPSFLIIRRTKIQTFQILNISVLYSFHFVLRHFLCLRSPSIAFPKSSRRNNFYLSVFSSSLINLSNIHCHTWEFIQHLHSFKIFFILISFSCVFILCNWVCLYYTVFIWYGVTIQTSTSESNQH